MPQGRNFQESVQRIDGLVRKLEEARGPEIRTSARDLAAALMELNAAGFERVLELVSRAAEGAKILDSFARDELVASLLILYGLHPDDFETRVRRAVSRLPGVEVASIEDGRVRLRMTGHPRNETAVRDAVLAAAPDFAELTVEGAQAGFVPLAALASPTGAPR